MSAEVSVPTLLGHPRGLFVLFLAEACERFSYYGMRALLALYLVRHFLFEDSQSFEIYAAYGAMVYFMPIVGGFIADRYLGFRKAVIYGAILLCIGHALMAFEGEAATIVDGVVLRDVLAMDIMFLALSFIIVGVGFLKPSISNIVGQLYGEEDPRRDQGFTIFYMGINLGAFTATIVCGYLGETYGWAYGFGLAGIVMLLGLGVFIRGQGLFGNAGHAPSMEKLREKVLGLPREWLIYVVGIILIVASWGMLQFRLAADILLYTVSVAGILGVFIYTKLKCTKDQQHRMAVILYLIVVSTVFWALFEQAGSSIKLFADRNVDLDVVGISVNASQVDALNPCFVILFAPLFAGLWQFLAARGWEPSTPMKFALGIVQAGLAALMIAFGTEFADSGSQVAFIWVVLAFVFFTTGELCLSPVGLSMVTRYSVAEVMGVMMGIWFVASSVGSLLSGVLAKLAAIDVARDQTIDASMSLPVYQDAFYTYGLIGVGTGVVLLVIAPFVRKYLHERRVVETT